MKQDRFETCFKIRGGFFSSRPQQQQQKLILAADAAAAAPIKDERRSKNVDLISALWPRPQWEIVEIATQFKIAVVQPD